MAAPLTQIKMADMTKNYSPQSAFLQGQDGAKGERGEDGEQGESVSHKSSSADMRIKCVQIFSMS